MTAARAAHALGRDVLVLRGAGDRWSFRFHRRTAAVCALLSGLLLVVLVASIFLGDFVVTPAGVIDTLLGRAPDRQTEFFVLQRRLPRALVAMTVGAALAIAGSVFQTLTRNPLASPDVIGISSGASVGAVAVMLVLGGSTDQAAVGAVVGALGAAGLMTALTARTGLHGVQLILTGVAVAAVATALVDYVLSQVYVASATTAQTWLIGSLQGRSWPDLVPAAIAVALIVPLLVWQAPAARMMGLGEGLALGLGVRTRRTRGVLLVAATLLVAVAVTTAGPISFVALVAPHIARSLARTQSFAAAALTGALVLALSDLIALYAFSAPIPVGAVTLTVGGGFFLWLLWREGRAHG